MKPKTNARSLLPSGPSYRRSAPICTATTPAISLMMPRTTSTTKLSGGTPGTKRQRQVQAGIGNDVAQFVEHGAAARFHVVLAGEHAVDRVECHANEQHGRHQQQARRANLDMQPRVHRSPATTTAAATVTWLAVTPWRPANW